MFKMAARPNFSRMRFVCFVYVLLNISVLALAENVPVYIMGLKSSSNYPSVSAFESLSHKDFRAKYLDQLAKDHKSIVAFVQDKLSPEDLSTHKSLAANEKAFPHLESNLKLSPSLILPSVKNPVESLRGLKSHMNVREVKHEDKFQADSLKPEVLIYHLPSTLKSGDKKDALRKNDEIIHNVMKQLKSNKVDFVSMYTGLNPSYDTKAEMESHYRIARELQETIEVTPNNFVADGNFLNSSDLIIYATGVNIRFSSVYFNFTNIAANLTWPPESYSIEVESNTSAIVTFSYPTGDGKNINNIVLKMTVSNDNTSRFWGAQEIELTANFPNAQFFNTKVFTMKPASYVFGASRGFSFSCSAAELRGAYKNISEKEDLYIKFFIQGLQAEWHPKSGSKFSESFDCYTFFTIPIWMGTLTVLLFTFILAIGIFMLFEVKTMDRFDDPKGKSITVPLAD